MRLLDLLHRWTGGLIGLVLALLGLSGAILVYRDDWISAPHTGDPLRGDLASVTQAVERIMSAPEMPRGILFASESFGLHRVGTGEGAGYYADQSGVEVLRWASRWERPEHWLFDFHHYLFAGDAGETVAGIAALCAVFFVISGIILWWRTRRTFVFRLWPRRLSRPAILMQHRDLGVVMAPLLLISAITGAMMVFRPVAMVVVAPFTAPSKVEAALKPPKIEGGPMAARFDYAAMLRTAHQRFPDGAFRYLSLPRKPGDLISIRLKRPAEWLPNGRTTLWFDPATGRLIEARDALAMPPGAQVYNAAYPLHAAKVGGLPYRLVMTVSGLALTILGSLAVWSFWFRRNRKPRTIVPMATATAS